MNVMSLSVGLEWAGHLKPYGETALGARAGAVASRRSAASLVLWSMPEERDGEWGWRGERDARRRLTALVLIQR